MEAHVFVEQGLGSELSASNVGLLAAETHGYIHLTWDQGLALVEKSDRALVGAPKRSRARIRAFRNQIVSAFGPEMADVCGWA